MLKFAINFSHLYGSFGGSGCKRLTSCCVVFLLFMLILSAESVPKQSASLLGNSALQLSRVGQSRVPVFSSVDGYVCFFLTAELIRPAKRKVGVFSVPKHGLALENMSLDVRQSKASPQDWLQILSLVESLQQVDLTGQLRVLLPEGALKEFTTISMPIVFKQEIYVPLSEDPRQVLILGHTAGKNEIYWKLKSKP
jgi:hypothetical protein